MFLKSSSSTKTVDCLICNEYTFYVFMFKSYAPAHTSNHRLYTKDVRLGTSASFSWEQEGISDYTIAILVTYFYSLV